MTRPLLFVVCLQLLAGSLLAADPPTLHDEIDAVFRSQSAMQEPPLCSDSEFLRRASLDLNGVPPTADEVRAFLADESPDKRAKMVDHLMASPRFERRLVEFLDVMLMERRANSNITQDEWVAWLQKRVQEKKGWNELARELLTANGADGERAAARFYLDRGSDPHLLTRDVGRIFLGRDLQCAQCHDHPLISDYLMLDYQGMLAVFSAGYEVKVKQGDKEVNCYAEHAGSDLQFESVFFKGTPHLSSARLFGGAEFQEPFFLPGDEYSVAPADKTIAVPKHSRRQQFADAATSGQIHEFNENMANRLWAFMMGEGLVPVLDVHQSENPPSNLELLQLAGQRFAATNFDMRNFLRELALTRVYQRAWDAPSDLMPHSVTASELLASAQSETAAIEQAATQADAALSTALSQFYEAEAQLVPAVKELQDTRTKYADQSKKVAEALTAVQKAEGDVSAKQAIVTPVAEASDKAKVAAEKLPEDKELAAAAATFAQRATQLAAELEQLQAAVNEKKTAHTATVEAQNAVKVEVEMALAKVKPLRDALQQKDAALVAARQASIRTNTKLNSHLQRVEALQQLVNVKVIRDQIAAQQQTIQNERQDLVLAQANVTDYAATVTTAQNNQATAQQAMQTAAAQLTAAETQHAEQLKKVQTLTVALTSTEAVQQQLPGDELIGDAIAKLKERSTTLNETLGQRATEVEQAKNQVTESEKQLAAATTAMQQVLQERDQRVKAQQDAQTRVDGAVGQLATLESNETQNHEALLKSLSRRAVLSDLQPLTAEQMCWSIFEVTGVYERYRAGEIAELDKASPLSDEAKQDPAQVLAREREIERRTYEKLKGNLGVFITTFAAGAGQPQDEFFATVDQALFTANGGPIQSWVAPAAGNVTERVVKAEAPEQAAEELYLGVFSRMPTPEETQDVAAYLASRGDQKPAAAQELVWSLISSAEFRFKH
ncbi:MAG: DUF1549 domain-containing protein [Planctomycetaceae bacterium]